MRQSFKFTFLNKQPCVQFYSFLFNFCLTSKSAGGQSISVCLQAVCALGPRCLMGEIEIRVICMQTRSCEHFVHLRIQVSFCVGIECVMGINCLWPFLKRFSRKTNLREFSSQTAAIDASCWLHKALYVSISECGNRER